MLAMLLWVALVSAFAAPTASTAIPIASPAPAPSDWVAHVAGLQFRSASGDSVGLSRALSDLGIDRAGTGPVTVTNDAARGIVNLCYGFAGQPFKVDTSPCQMSVTVRAQDAGVPPGAIAGSLDGTEMGDTYDQLLAALHANSALDSKNVVKGNAGDVVFVDAKFSYPHSTSHGSRQEWEIMYFLRDGVVVANALNLSE